MDIGCIKPYLYASTARRRAGSKGVTHPREGVPEKMINNAMYSIKFDDKWTFMVLPEWFGMHWNTWAVSANKLDSNIILDPWKDSIEVRPPKSPNKGNK